MTADALVPEAPSFEPVDELLTAADVGALFKVSEATLYSWRHRGVGPESFKVLGLVRYRRSQVESWLAEQEQSTARGGAVVQAVAS